MAKISSQNFLVIVLILVLLVNTIVHFSHPAYRYYRDQFEQLRTVNNDFHKRVMVEVCQAIVSNNTLHADSRVSTLVHKTEVATSAVMSGSSSSNNVYSLAFRYFLNQGVPSFEYDSRHYSFGDSFYGSPVVFVTPTMLRTLDKVFVLPLLGSPSSSSAVAPSQASKHSPSLVDILKGVNTNGFNRTL